MTVFEAPLEKLDSKTDIVAGKWQQLRGTIRERWGEITDSDLDRVAGKRDRLIGLLQEKYGYTRQEANKRVNQLTRMYTEKKEELQTKGEPNETPSWFTRNRSLLALAAATATISAGVAFYLNQIRNHD